jgi:hypothetical protein
LEGDLAGLSGRGIPIDERILVHFIDGAHELCELGLIKQVRLVLLLGGPPNPRAQRPRAQWLQVRHLVANGLQDMQTACR